VRDHDEQVRVFAISLQADGEKRLILVKTVSSFRLAARRKRAFLRPCSQRFFHVRRLVCSENQSSSPEASFYGKEAEGFSFVTQACPMTFYLPKTLKIVLYLWFLTQRLLQLKMPAPFATSTPMSDDNKAKDGKRLRLVISAMRVLASSEAA